MLTIRKEIKREEVKSDGTYNIKIRFTLNRKIRRLPTSFFCDNKSPDNYMFFMILGHKG